MAAVRFAGRGAANANAKCARRRRPADHTLVGALSLCVHLQNERETINEVCNPCELHPSANQPPASFFPLDPECVFRILFLPRAELEQRSASAMTQIDKSRANVFGQVMERFQRVRVCVCCN